MTTKRDLIIAKAVEVIEAHRDGIRWTDLIKTVQMEFPNTPNNTIQGSLWDLDTKRPDQIYKPARGLWRHIRYKETTFVDEARSVPLAKVKEEDFYQPFAEWLVNDLEECTKAIPLGRNKFRDKWGTPDVLGIREARRSDIIQFPTEIISAEIKLDTNAIITAFGQSCAYKLFSHKSYLVVPTTSPEADIARIDALCRIFGVGLILFENLDPSTPQFDIRVRASRHEPDMFYVNEYIRLIERELFS